MSSRINVKSELKHMVAQLDEVFGEGFAASNPALVEKALDVVKKEAGELIGDLYGDE